MQVRVWVPAAVMRRAQATMVQGTGPGSSGLTLTVLSDFQESSVPLQVTPACPCTHLTSRPTCTGSSRFVLSGWISPAQSWPKFLPDIQTGHFARLTRFLDRFCLFLRICVCNTVPSG